MRSFQNYASITDSFFSKIVNLPNNQKNSTGTQTMQLRKLGDKKKEIRYLRPSQLQSGFQEIRKSANINSAFLGHGRSRKIQEAEEKVSRGFMMETEMRRGQEGIIRLNPRSQKANRKSIGMARYSDKIGSHISESDFSIKISLSTQYLCFIYESSS